jgi:ribonuclease HI
VANIDGGSRGNPGPAAYAVVLRDPDGRIILELAKKFGRDTNNVAEYYGLLAALDYATTHGIKALRVRSDSELLVRQMQGRYKVKSPDLKPLYERALKMTRQLQYFVIEHVRRELNTEADALANLALDGSNIFSEGSGAKVDAAALSGSSSGTQPTISAPPALGTASDAPKRAPARKIRARYANGVLVPSEPLDLPEGAEVELSLRIRREN